MQVTQALHRLLQQEPDRPLNSAAPERLAYIDELTPRAQRVIMPGHA